MPRVVSVETSGSRNSKNPHFLSGSAVVDKKIFERSKLHKIVSQLSVLNSCFMAVMLTELHVAVNAITVAVETRDLTLPNN